MEETEFTKTMQTVINVIDRCIKVHKDKVKKLEEENMAMASLDHVDHENHGSHMMAKQILSQLKHPADGHVRFGEPLANDIVDMYTEMRKAYLNLLYSIRSGRTGYMGDHSVYCDKSFAVKDIDSQIKALEK